MTVGGARVRRAALTVILVAITAESVLSASSYLGAALAVSVGVVAIAFSVSERARGEPVLVAVLAVAMVLWGGSEVVRGDGLSMVLGVVWIAIGVLAAGRLRGRFGESQLLPSRSGEQ